MKYLDLSERWKLIICEFLLSNGISERKTLNSNDFDSNSMVQITFDDESKAEFRHAFFIESKDLMEIGVFTEHCGYYILNRDMAHVVELKKISRV